MKTLVIGDVHGNHRGLVQALERAKFDYENDTLISLGDIVDGFLDSYECVEELLKVKNLLTVKGNHDEVWLNYLETGKHAFHWLHGGDTTLRSYARHADRDITISPQMGGYETNFTKYDIPDSHIKFFKDQKPCIIDEDGNVFVHGGFNRHLKLSEQTPSNIFWWDRDLFSQAQSAHSRNGEFYLSFKDDFINRVFIGHTPTINWNKKGKENSEPIFADRVINLDTGGGYNGGKITVMDVDSKEFWQSDFGYELYEKGGRDDGSKYKNKRPKKDRTK